MAIMQKPILLGFKRGDRLLVYWQKYGSPVCLVKVLRVGSRLPRTFVLNGNAKRIFRFPVKHQNLSVNAASNTAHIFAVSMATMFSAMTQLNFAYTGCTQKAVIFTAQ